jgi:hypothetical protein
VNGQTGVSGLRFFYWTQSFGRITGENTWKNGADFFFLLQSMSWAFLPWGVLFVIALILNATNLVKQKFRLTPQQEWISTGGFLLTYVSLAVSKYQLPHYIFVAFPLVAIMVAKLLRDFMLEGRHKKLYAFLKPFQAVITALIFIAVLLMLEFVFPAGVMGWVLWSIGVVVWLYIAFSKKIKGKLLWISAAGIIIANVFVTNHFYYHLLHYQMGSLAGRYIRDAGINAEDIATFKPEDPKDALPFYAKERIPSDDVLPSAVKSKYLLTTDMGKKELDSAKITYTVLNSGGFYKVSELTPEFLNPATRASVLKNYYILKLQ